MARRLAFFTIVWSYTVLVALYAVNTPLWQVPDEPAHYNYIRTVAELGALPVLQAGDYNQAYLDEIKARKFPPDMSIESIRYESHQPPLYYLLGASVYDLGAGTSVATRLLSLRLFSSLWGAVLLAIVYRIALELFPGDGIVPLLAASLAGFVPQHLAMLAGVDNDALADVILAAIVLGLLRIVRLAGHDSRLEQRTWWVVGILTGLGLLTKTTTYVSAGLIALTLLMVWRNSGRFAQTLTLAAPALLFALVLGSLWFTRDALTYGPTDWLGLGRHDAVVVGQPRTLELYPNYYVAATYYFPILFRSFWGQFGWMAVPLDDRLYTLLLSLVLVALSGLVARVFKVFRGDGRRWTPSLKTMGLFLLASWFLFTLLTAIWYSLDFFQAQGRYLFPALGAIAVFLAMGLSQWIRFIGGALVRLRVSRSLTEWCLTGCVAVGLAVVDWVSLFRFLIPALR